MIFKQPQNGSFKIGRKIEFNNPLRYSNKKHYWAGCVGNYGMLTTEQIQILNQMKKKEKRSHLYDMKSVENGLNYSIKEVKYGMNAKKQKTNNYYQSFEEQNQDFKYEDQKRVNMKQPKSKRSVSEFRSYDEGQQGYKKFSIIDYHQTPTGLSRINKDNAIKRLQSGKRRVKTLGIEQMNEALNPQSINRIDQKFYEPINTDKLKTQNRHLRMQSGNIRVNHSPQTLKNISESIKNPSPFLQQKIYSERSEKQSQNEPISMNQYSKQNMLEQPEKIDKKMVIMDKKRLTRQRFRRDHSPTFCNSIEYPLKYFRHI